MITQSSVTYFLTLDFALLGHNYLATVDAGIRHELGRSNVTQTQNHIANYLLSLQVC